jgi:hypothetical protein
MPHAICPLIDATVTSLSSQMQTCIDLCALARHHAISVNDACLSTVMPIDSGSTRTTVSYGVYDRCNEIVDWCEVHHELISYVDETKTHAGSLSNGFLLMAAERINAVVEQLAIDYQVPEFSCAIATGGMRAATNAVEAAQQIASALDVPFYKVTQEQEGVIGFSGALVSTHIPANELLVWDMGGATQQKIWLSDGKMQVEGLPIAAGNFLQKMQGQFVNLTTDIYPVEKEQLVEMISLASQEISAVTPLPQGKQVVGIGGHKYTAQVYAEAFAGAADDHYTFAQVEKALFALADSKLEDVMQLVVRKETMSAADQMLFAKRGLAAMLLIYTSMLHSGISVVYTADHSNLRGLAAMECHFS